MEKSLACSEQIYFINVKIYDYIMEQCTKTSEIMLSIDGHNCSIQKCFSELIYGRKPDVKNLLNFFLPVHYETPIMQLQISKPRQYAIGLMKILSKSKNCGRSCVHKNNGMNIFS